MAMAWDHYLKLWEVPEDQWEAWKGSNKVTFTLTEDGSGMSVLYDGITEPLEYKFGEETDIELEEAAGGNSKQRMVRSGPSSVLLTINKEDLGIMETKNIVFHPHGVQVWNQPWITKLERNIYTKANSYTHELNTILHSTFPLQISSSVFKPAAFMSAQLYEWYDRVDEEGNKKTLYMSWL